MFGNMGYEIDGLNRLGNNDRFFSESKETKSSASGRYTLAELLNEGKYKKNGKKKNAKKSRDKTPKTDKQRKRHQSEDDDHLSHKRGNFQELDAVEKTNEEKLDLEKANEFAEQVADSLVCKRFFYEKWFSVREKLLNDKYKTLDRLHTTVKKIYETFQSNSVHGTPEWIAGEWLKLMWELKWNTIDDDDDLELDRSLPLKTKLKDYECSLQMYLRKRRRRR